MNDKQVFVLQQYPDFNKSVTGVIVPKEVTRNQVQAAWSYAIEHSPLTLQKPDYDKAIKLLLERHPSWQLVSVGHGITISVDLKYAKDDEPET